ncbi:MAG: Dabb family protein [Phycisphaerales bacterium]|nr:Dabb family protein [Phycisphaerales bacterium]
MRRLLCSIFTLPLVACQSSPSGGITHVVLASLEDPSEVPALLEDCEAMLSGIDVVHGFACGAPIDVGRGDRVVKDYDVGLHMVFETAEDYEAYVVHPRHVEILERWGPKFTALRIYDFGAEASDR